MSPSVKRLADARQAMREHGVHAWLIPSADPHLSEYLPAHWQIRQWLTGFTGSVGTVIVTESAAGLWVDSRYWDQAQQELAGTGFELQPTTSSQDTSHLSWLASHLMADEVLAVDGRTLSLSAFEALQNQLSSAVTCRLDLDIADLVWGNRPALPQAPVWVLPDAFAGDSRINKLAQVRSQMKAFKANHHFISTLDDIAWVLNLRGSDVEFNPVFLSHLLIGPEQATLFVAPEKVNHALVAALAADGVAVADYSRAFDQLAALPQTDCLLLDPKRTTCRFAQATLAPVVRAMNPSTRLKACKNQHELSHWRQTMVADGQALCEFFAALELAIEARAESPFKENMIDQWVTQARSQQPGFVGPSFATIAAFNANGAMAHYRATDANAVLIEGDGLLLIDSGGQYLGGTTDITRMVPVGKLSEAQRSDCTVVLQGMIALSRLRFPNGTPAPLVDAVARAPLWQHGLDYGHGTGHGVGYFLNVHEGPQVLSYRAPPSADMALLEGMVTSNEPGLYRSGQWGVRIENLVCCQAVDTTEFGEFLAFETLTLCPIDTRCFVLEQLRPDERQWLNDYHRMVRDRLSPGLSPTALRWLFTRTESLPL
jgi:Xaa-Pro aminopeptidase